MLSWYIKLLKYRHAIELTKILATDQSIKSAEGVIAAATNISDKIYAHYYKSGKN